MSNTSSYIQHPNGYSSFLSVNHHYLNDSVGLNSTHLLSYNDRNFLSHSNDIKQLQNDNKNQPLSLSFVDTTNNSLIPSMKKHSRVIPIEEKDNCYYEKRTRNNESAKRSRDARRIKEQEIQERVTFLEHENSRLSIENQTIRYQISQLHALNTRISS